METKLLIVLELVCLAVAQGQKKVCFAPVACSAGDVTSSEWMEIDSKTQCTDKPSEGIVPTQASITESRIKTLINESVAEFRSELTNLLASKGDSDELNRLRNDVNEMNQTLNQNKARLERELMKINETFRLLNDSLQPKPSKCETRGGVMYDGRCYWLILRSNVKFGEAEKLCIEAKGQPADILNQVHYDLIEVMAKRRMTSSFMRIWTGMKINPTTKAMTKYDGSSHSFAVWYKNYPKSSTNHDRIMLLFEKDLAREEGMFNHSPTHVGHGVLCQQ